MRKIISVSGFIGSGKDTVADYLINTYSFTKLSFAASLKDAVAVIFGWDRKLLEGDTPESRQWREAVDEWWATRLGIPTLTPRWVLQHWGTEVCRTGFHEDIWVASLENKIHAYSNNVVITDGRFPNELTAIRNIGGTLLRVERGEQPAWYDNAVMFNLKLIDTPPAGVHASEYSSVGLKYDYYVENNSSKEDLYKKVDLIINN